MAEEKKSMLLNKEETNLIRKFRRDQAFKKKSIEGVLILFKDKDDRDIHFHLNRITKITLVRISVILGPLEEPRYGTPYRELFYQGKDKTSQFGKLWVNQIYGSSGFVISEHENFIPSHLATKEVINQVIEKMKEKRLQALNKEITDHEGYHREFTKEYSHRKDLLNHVHVEKYSAKKHGDISRIYW